MFVWETAALTALVLMLPTVVRLFFDLDSGRKWLRFASKLLLGLGVGLGIYSILLSTDILIQLFQLTFGIAVYAGIAYRKSKNPYPECGPCSYNPSRVCPGIGPFYGIDILNTVPMADTDQFRLNSRDSA
ncbi:MAG TPA: hypothetical protein VJ044_13520 [Candidatus Hodarchaeales archaeon]|nr:hypothetical protein [Candidatus Hodarchaeales archaeon]